MAYTQNKELKTRIALKYDTYANWQSNNPVLLAGEIAIATIPSGTSVPTKSGREMQDLPNVVMKVGNGSANYNDLPFVSALAADVYDWAKAAVKPTYAASEIQGLEKFVTDISDIDTNTQYSLVADGTYKWKLQKKEIGEDVWSDYQVIDLTDVDTRLDAAESKLDALVGTGTGTVADQITAAIQKLDVTKTQVASADNGWVSATLVETDGLLSEVNISVDGSKYDAAGAAKTVQGETTHTVAEAYALADAAQTAEEVAAAVKKEEDARKAAIESLDYSAYEAGSATGTTISFVGEISETNGIIAATKRDLVFESAYDPSTNKAATMTDVTKAVADLNGAMHFEGVKTEVPTDNTGYAAGDVIIVGLTEYVFDGSKWVELGNEGTAGALIAGLDVDDITVGADSTLSVIGEADGLIHATPVKIKIAENQVTGLVDDLASKATNADLKAATDDIANLQEAINNLGGGAQGSVSDQITNAINALDKPDSAVEGQYVSAVSQTDGVITVTRAALPVIPDVEVAQGTVTPGEGEVAVVTGVEVDSANKHKLNVARSTAITAAAVNAKIQALDATITPTSDKHVLTGITETDGVLTGKTEVALADVAFSGDVKDLVQTAETYVLFNCGTSSEVI